MKNKKKNLFKTLLKGIMIIPLLSILLTGCEKYEFEEVVITPPTLWGEWELIETSHVYIDINEVGADHDTSWVNLTDPTYIAMNTGLDFDLVTPNTTTWTLSENMYVTVDGEDVYDINRFIYPSESMNPYDQCWDINQNGQQDYFEDINGDGICDVFDCTPPGIVIGVYNTLRAFEVIELTNHSLTLKFEGQYFEDFDYYTTVLKFNKR